MNKSVKINMSREVKRSKILMFPSSEEQKETGNTDICLIYEYYNTRINTYVLVRISLFQISKEFIQILLVV